MAAFLPRLVKLQLSLIFQDLLDLFFSDILLQGDDDGFRLRFMIRHGHGLLDKIFGYVQSGLHDISFL